MVFFALALFFIRIAVLSISINLASVWLAIAGSLIMAALFCITAAGLLGLFKKLLPWIISKLGALFYRLKGEHGYESVD